MGNFLDNIYVIQKMGEGGLVIGFTLGLTSLEVIIKNSTSLINESHRDDIYERWKTRNLSGFGCAEPTSPRSVMGL